MEGYKCDKCGSFQEGKYRYDYLMYDWWNGIQKAELCLKCQAKLNKIIKKWFKEGDI